MLFSEEIELELAKERKLRDELAEVLKNSGILDRIPRIFNKVRRDLMDSKKIPFDPSLY